MNIFGTILICIVLTFNLFGQNTKQILDGFDYRNYESPGYDINICPWQSWRLLPYLSMQIDVVVDDTALEVLQKDKWVLVQAIYDFYYGGIGKIDATELSRRFAGTKRVKFHTPGLTWPYHLKWELAPVPGYATYDDMNNPQWGWERRVMNDNTSMAVKTLPNGEHQVSIALFMRPINIYSKAQEVNKIYIKEYGFNPYSLGNYKRGEVLEDYFQNRIDSFNVSTFPHYHKH